MLTLAKFDSILGPLLRGVFISLLGLFLAVQPTSVRMSVAYAKMGDAAMIKGIKTALDKVAEGLKNKRVRLKADFLGYAGTTSERDYLEVVRKEIKAYLKEKYNIELISFLPNFQENGRGEAPPRVNINFVLDENLSFPEQVARSDEALPSGQVEQHSGEVAVLSTESKLDEAAQKQMAQADETPLSEQVGQYNKEGAAFFKEGRFDEAVQRFDKALDLDPENKSVIFNRAVALHRMGRLDNAESEYLKLMQDGESLRVQLMLGVLYQEKGQKDRAIELYEKVLAASPDNALAKKRLSQLTPEMKAAGSGSPSVALALSQKQLKRRKGRVPKRKLRFTERELKSHAHNRTGIEAYLERDYARAFGEFIDAVILDPDNVQARFNLGVAYQLRERYGEAIVEFQKVLQVEDVPRAHVMLGATYVMQGRYKDAIAELRDVVFFDFDSWRVSPEGTRAIGEFAKIMRDTGGDSPLRLDGHADSTGPADYNADLSKKRAIAVALEMVIMNRLNPDALFISGRGEGEPAAANRTVAGRRLNRRVEMIVPAVGALH